MDDLVRRGQTEGGLARVMFRYYGPHMLRLFDWTGAIITLMAFLFTVGWLRRTGELTAVLSAGISHGRIFRSMIVASLLIVVVQLVNREFVLPGYRDALTMKAKEVAGTAEQAILPQYDKTNRILVDGSALVTQLRVIREPSFRLYGDYPGFGDLLLARSARWLDATDEHPAGYLLDGVERPELIDRLPSVGLEDRSILMTSRDQVWLGSRQCFFATTVNTDLLQTNQSSTRLSSVSELARRIRNPSVHSSLSIRVLFHERIVRPPLDFALIMLGLPLVVNRKGRNLFVMIGAAMLTVLGFFVVKTLASTMGGSGFMLSPTMAAWMPLLVVGPLAYVRLRDVQIV